MKPVAELAFLGRMFLMPDARDLAVLAKELDLPAWEQAVTHDGDRMELEYNRLFLNPQGTPCPPWQSAHSDEPHLMGEAHLSALAWFRRFDIQPAAMNEPADHIGLLLLFYAHLLETDAQPDTLDDFRAAHLDWVPNFCETVKSATTLALYRAACDRLQEIVRGGLQRSILDVSLT